MGRAAQRELGLPGATHEDVDLDRLAAHRAADGDPADEPRSGGPQEGAQGREAARDEAHVAIMHVACRRNSDLARGGKRVYLCRMTNPKGAAIRILRERLGLTQEEFAHELAVTVSTVNRWENARTVPSKLAWHGISVLAQARGVDVESRPDVPARRA